VSYNTMQTGGGDHNPPPPPPFLSSSTARIKSSSSNNHALVCAPFLRFVRVQFWRTYKTFCIAVGSETMQKATAVLPSDDSRSK
jgi:hypothetical protein